jgi:tetratricopeptide (TPR) repeat protein
MKTSSRIAAFTLVLCLGGVALIARKLEVLRAGATLEETMLLRSPKLARYMSLGYTGLAADIYWTRAIQYFGEKHQTRTSRYELLEPLLNLTTTLDPHLIVAYEFGAFFLAQKAPQGAGDPEAAVRLVERGIRQNPDRWRLYFNLGFIHYIERHDYEAAARAFEAGSRHPHALPWMKTMAAKMREKAGDVNIARALWTNIYETSTESTMRENAKQHLVALRVQEDLAQLRNLLAGYTQRHGRCVTDWKQAVADGIIAGVPLDPAGNAYQLVPGCRVKVHNESRFIALAPEAHEVQF